MNEDLLFSPPMPAGRPSVATAMTQVNQAATAAATTALSQVTQALRILEGTNFQAPILKGPIYIDPPTRRAYEHIGARKVEAVTTGQQNHG